MPTVHSAQSPVEKLSYTQKLDDWQILIIEFFVDLAMTLGLQKSVGQIYGLLYVTEHPLCMHDIMATLGISKGSVSQGLKALRSLGAAKLVFISGERRDHFEPEVRFKHLIGSILRNQIIPQLESGRERITNARQSLRQTPQPSKLAKSRIDKLDAWTSKTRKVIPVMQKLVGEV